VLVLAALADPVRREIVELLAAGEATAGGIAERFPVSRPAVSRHLRVLREAGLVTAVERGRERVYALERAPLDELHRWLERVRPAAAEPIAAERSAPGPAGRLDALGTELHRGRRRAAAGTNATATEGDVDDRTA
jgi:DNA-binding transcriptional ArsR family regulator